LEVEGKEEEAPQPPIPEGAARPPNLSRIVGKEPIVEKVLDIFDGQIVEAKPKREKER